MYVWLVMDCHWQVELVQEMNPVTQKHEKILRKVRRKWKTVERK